MHREFMTPGSIPRPLSGRVLGRAICVCVLAFAICSIAPPVVVAQPSGEVPGMDYFAADGDVLVHNPAKCTKKKPSVPACPRSTTSSIRG